MKRILCSIRNGVGVAPMVTMRGVCLAVSVIATQACLVSALAAEPVTISFTQASKPGLHWKVKAPTGSQIVVTAKPEFFKQSKSITLKYGAYGTTVKDSGWKESLFPPGPTSLTLNAKGVAAGPLKFNISTLWSVMACYSWKPPGSAQKTDSCSGVVYFEGVDPLKEGANKLIAFFFHPPSNVSAKPGKVAVKPSGQDLRLRVAKDVLIRSTNKKFRLYWDSGGILPENEKHPPGHVYFGPNPKWAGTAATVDMEGNDWGEIVVPLNFGPHNNKQNWTLKACTEIDWSGEICSITRQIELVQTPVIKMSDQPKDYKVDTNQPLPPLSPPPSGGGGGGKENMMAPPPVLGAPATNVPVPAAPAPQSPPPAPMMSPAAAPAPADTGRTAPTAGVPGCAPVPGAPGQYACATREAYAGCERLRASAASGVRLCQGGGDRLRR